MNLTDQLKEAEKILFDMEDNLIKIETSTGILETFNNILHDDIYCYNYSDDLLYNFKCGFNRHQNLTYSTLDYLIKVQEELKVISEYRNRLYEIMRSEEVEKLIEK